MMVRPSIVLLLGLAVLLTLSEGRRPLLKNVNEVNFLDKIKMAADDEPPMDISPDPYIFESTQLPVNPKMYPSVGNGHLATTIYRDSIFVNGIYNGETGWSHRARFPSLYASNFTLDSTDAACLTATHTYSLNLRDGVFTETMKLPGVTVTYRIYAHQFYNRLLIAEVSLARISTCTGCCVNDNITIIRQDLGTKISDDLLPDPQQNYPCGTDQCWTQNGKTKEPEATGYTTTNFTIYWKEMPLTFTLPENEMLANFTFIYSVDQSATIAKSNFDEALTLNSDVLLANHTAAFRAMWASGSIDVTGDLHLDKVIHGCLYYLYTSLPAHPTFSPNYQFSGLSPGGLPNGANATDYQGHVFWDMETWMYPPMLIFRPDLARDMLSYRINGMVPAMKRATDGGYEGARFPWESAFTGEEVTPVICIPCRENQQHITVDIAFAARQYVSATRDLNWLTTSQAGGQYRGFDFIKEMAKFWQSRCVLNASTGRYDINGVMPPDEHQESVDNSIYTNVGASKAIHYAKYVGCLIGDTSVPDTWISKAQQLAFTYQREKRYHEEFQGYDNEVETDTTDPRGVKQADVVMLGFPFLWEMPDDVRKNDLVHYEEVTNPDGPAMTWGIHAIGWLDLGDYSKADAMFVRAYDSYAREPFKIWTEVQSGDGAVNFITGMGGFLQSVVFGYGGLRLDVDELRFNKPRLPPKINLMSFKSLDYLDSEFDMSINTTHVTIAVVKMGAHPLNLTTTNPAASYSLKAGDSFALSFQEFKVKATDVPNCSITKPEITVDYSTLDNSASVHHLARTVWLLIFAACILNYRLN